MIITDIDFLRQSCLEVFPDEVGELKDKLENELKLSEKNGQPGIGLSAIQIGILKKFAIVRIGNLSIDLVNAEIEKGYDEIIFKDEGCLSFPGKNVTTKRFQEIVIKNNLVRPERCIITGIAAICCQHEIGHYNQKLMFDFEIKTKKK